VACYTLGQVKFYGEAIDRERRRSQRDLAFLIRAASQYPADDFKAFVED